MSRKKKACSKCKKELTLANYNKDRRNNDGLRYDCKLCQYKAHHKHLTKKIEVMEEQWKRK